VLPPPHVPQVIGKYKVLHQLTGNAKVTVYKGVDPHTEEPVAIKVASREIVDHPVLLKRFKQEYTVTRNLAHPNLIRALSFGHQDTAPYIVFEYVSGPSLGDRLEREGRLSEDEAVHVIRQVAGALGEAHKNRVIHRDVKPDNILLTDDGQAKLIDLGLAKDFDDDQMLTRPSTGLGTPNFMAPEQFSDAKHADERCDVYSLGATLYMAVTGQLPFLARSLKAMLDKKAKNDLVPPGQLVPDLSPQVEAAICRSVRANPLERPASCLQFLEVLSGAGSWDTRKKQRRSLSRGMRGGWAGNEDRRATSRLRSSLEGSCRVVGTGKESEWPLRIHDISADGIALLLGRRFEPRSVLLVEVSSNTDVQCRFLLVRVIRAAPMQGKTWLVGCVFAHRLGKEDVEILRGRGGLNSPPGVILPGTRTGDHRPERNLTGPAGMPPRRAPNW
jgi:serine/threonine protein kinase